MTSLKNGQQSTSPCFALPKKSFPHLPVLCAPQAITPSPPRALPSPSNRSLTSPCFVLPKQSLPHLTFMPSAPGLLREPGPWR
eukprot:354217-Chlamydomonas_euryale.AAC.1